MILIFLASIIVISFIYSKFLRCFMILLLSLFFVFGHIAIVVSNNMYPNINNGDYLLCIRPTISLNNNNTIIADLQSIPLLGNLFKYKIGQTIIIKSNKNNNNITIIKPKIFRIICDDQNIFKIKNNNFYINNTRIKYERFSNYLIEKLPNGKKYLVDMNLENMNDEIINLEKNKLLCMYDNRNSHNKLITILDKKLVHSIPIINITNVIKYYKFLAN